MDRRTLEKRYDQVADEVFTLRLVVRDREQELAACRPQLYRANQRIDRLQRQRDKLAAENKLLKAKLADLSAQLRQEKSKAKVTPSFVKANVPAKRVRKKPGRGKGHAAALRPMPRTVDVHQEVPLPVDESGKPSCPICHTQLLEVREYLRHVEELIPFKLLTTCYHTAGGYCPGCRKVVESRAPDQPPAADVPHGQFGLNALATAAVMRVCYRMPLRQITRLFAHLPGMQLSPGAIVKQIKRLGRWLEKQYHELKLTLRAAGVVHADETGWRTDGKNGYLWTLTDAGHTLYHVDRSRGGHVIVDLLGKAFGSTGDQTLVSDYYSVYDRFEGRQQKCLTHLLRELRDTIATRPELAGHEFFRRCRQLIKQMLKLKKQRQALGESDYTRRVESIEKRLEELARLDWSDPDAERLGKRLYKYRDKLTTFLHHHEVDGTNNAAERALRPAVVMRKITGGNRSASGARAWAILASVMRTAEQQGRNVLETIKTLLRAEWAAGNIAPPAQPAAGR
jgi:transposase